MGKVSISFQEWVNEEGMIDMSFIRPQFTWNHGNLIDQWRSARLDRGLFDEEWHRKYPDVTITHCPHVYFDHCLLVLRTHSQATERLGEIPFRFQSAWLSHKYFMEFPNANWLKG